MENSIKAQGKKSKRIFHLETPFTTPKWPKLTSEEEVVVIELLCSLFSPIGLYRTTHVPRSKGKRHKRAVKKASETNNPPHDASPPPPPVLSTHITLGINSTLTHLQNLSRHSLPATYPLHLQLPPKPTSSPQTPPTHLSAIFVPFPDLDPVLRSHLCHVAFTASMTHPTLPSTLLVPLPKSANARLANALGVPRVGCVGLMETAPETGPLLEYVREHVVPVRVPWLDKTTKYLPVQIGVEEKEVAGGKGKQNAGKTGDGKDKKIQESQQGTKRKLEGSLHTAV
ncbi:MAG: hypothetical protein M1833_006054 [Piccolia ochrophora]|nr:MAG: hypothetical protein M1833_006054 [Piccolia ochrophora]